METTTDHVISLTINGQARQLSVSPWTSLLDLLREDLHLTGTKKGCDHGQCGSCTGKRISNLPITIDKVAAA